MSASSRVGIGKSRSIPVIVLAIALLGVSATFAFANGPLAFVFGHNRKSGQGKTTASKLPSAKVGEAVRVTRSRYFRFHHYHPSEPPSETETTPPTPPPDTTPPDTLISSGPSGTTTVTTASFAFTSTESNSTFECKLGSGNWRTCSSPKTYSGVSVGSHLFSVRAIDIAKNVDASPATRSWTVEAEEAPPPPPDTTAPDTSITNGPASPTTSSSASFSFSSTETGSNFECKLDSGSWGACAVPKSYSSLALGGHQFWVRAVDAAKNVDTSPATEGWTVQATEPPADTTPPDTSIASGPSGMTTSITASFTFTSTESSSTFECKLDSGSWAACSSPEFYSGVSVGSHLFSVRAIDIAKNVDASPATRSWTVEAEEAPPPPPPPPPAECSSVVSSASAAQSAASSAAPGAVICLADGSYGKLTLSATKSAPGVTVRAENAGQATIAGASMSGARLTLARFNVTDEVTIQPGATAMVVDHNRITGGYMGVNAGPTSTTQINDTVITNNKFVGPFGEDAIRLNRYHDSNGDGIGVLIEGNEITGVRENGNHSDCLQAVWVGDHIVYRKNYLHDNRCQGFFVKDQASLGGVSGPIEGISVEDNLFVRDNEPCAPEAPGCGQPSYFQVFGPYSGFTMRRNTFWTGDQVAVFQEGTGPDTKIENNVIYRFWTNTNMSGIAYTSNTRCKRETSAGGSWPSSTPGETVDCAPSFNNPAADDLRLIGSSRGVDWAPAEQHYGP